MDSLTAATKLMIKEYMTIKVAISKRLQQDLIRLHLSVCNRFVIRRMAQPANSVCIVGMSTSSPLPGLGITQSPTPDVLLAVASSSCPTSNRHHVGQTLIPFTPTEGQEHGMMIISPKDLNIVWGGDERYWRWDVPVEEAVMLAQVAYLEVSGSVKNIDPNKDYEVGFSLSFDMDHSPSLAFIHRHRWNKLPTFIMAKRGKLGRFTWKKSTFDVSKTGDRFEFKTTLNKAEIPRQDDPDLQDLYFGMYDVWSYEFKAGLIIHHAFVKQSP